MTLSEPIVMLTKSWEKFSVSKLKKWVNAGMTRRKVVSITVIKMIKGTRLLRYRRVVKME